MPARSVDAGTRAVTLVPPMVKVVIETPWSKPAKLALIIVVADFMVVLARVTLGATMVKDAVPVLVPSVAATV